jgi:DNA-binding Lrp family transcriptional regulator
MGKIPRPQLQEIILGSSDKAESKRIKALEKQQLIRRIAPRIYTSNLEEKPEVIIRRNWFTILANQYPDALLSHRSALEFKPTPSGHIYTTYTYTENVQLPGLTIHFLKGPAKVKGDNPFVQNLHASQEARAFLENMQESRKRGEESKTLSRNEVEDRLEVIIRVRGEKGLNAIRDTASELAPLLKMEKEFKKLDQLISDLLATGDFRKIQSPIAKARAFGELFDPDRINLFEQLYGTLAGGVFPDYNDKNASLKAYQTFAFFEGYYSNYIEGTEFAVSEAREIISTETPIFTRDEDSHDILGTYRIVSNKREMSICPSSPDEFLNILRRRHAILLEARHSKKPGLFKDKNNRAGSTEFVDWQLVTGTLKKGFEFYNLLQHPFAKAAYMMFLVSEVHPFLDGNGRIARVMMNAELTARGLTKIIIPTVYREDYMGALKKLTKQSVTDPYIRMLLRAYEFSETLNGEDIDAMEQFLIECDAFKEPKEGKLKIIKV